MKETNVSCSLKSNEMKTERGILSGKDSKKRDKQ
jgi:hypothetical protein